VGRISQALVPVTRTPRAVTVVEQQRSAGPMGVGLIKWAVGNGLAPLDLAKAVEREAARTTDIRDLAVRLAGPDPTMGAPWASFDGNRLTGAQMGPGQPATPFPLGGDPRQFQYRVGWNYPSPPDTDRGVDGELLRVLADSFDLLRLCIEIRKNDMCHLDWDVIPTEKNRSKREQWLKDNAGELEQIKQFFEWPEAYVTQDAAGHWVRRGKVRFDVWLGALLEDFFVGDWLTIWPRQLHNGATVALDRVDGMNIKPLLDLDGRTPEPPMPAYQHYLYGVPRASFTLDELLYRPRTVRNHTPFGFSHVEQMLVLVNLALRFQMWETQAYTESALPLGLLEFPENFSPDQIEAVVETLNQAISGLAGERQKFHGVPSGTKWNAIKPFEWDQSFAQYLVEYTAAMFRLNAMKLGFMPGRGSGGQGLGGKGFSEQQSENDENKSTIPDARWIEGLMNEVIQRYFNRTDVEFVFTELQSDDEQSSIDADKEAIFAGLKSWDQALEERGEEPVGISEPFLMAPNGIIYSVSDIQAIQDPASNKEYERAQAPGLPIWSDPDAEPEPAPFTAGGLHGGPSVPPLGSGSADGGDVPQRQPSGAPGQATDRSGSRGAAPREPGSSATGNADASDRSSSAASKAEKFDTTSGFQPRPTLDPRGVQDELRRWKRKSVKAWRNGKRDVAFDTEIVPETLKAELLGELAKADDVLDVRVAFDHAIEKAADMKHPMGQAGLEWANYRHAEELERSCGTCAFFHRQDGGLSTCSMFDVLVDGDFTCEEWRGRVSQKDSRNSETTHAGLVVRAADTGRVLMLQRSIKDEADPARGTWEFPGGGLEPGETPLEGAIREWQEETGVQLPPGTLHGSWKNGIYEGHVYVVPSEQDVPLNVDAENRTVANPDDPDGDDAETLAWWAPSEARTNPALRPECELCDWDMIDGAVPGAQFKLAGVLVDLAKAAAPSDGDTDREKRIKQLAAVAGAALASHAVGVYGQKVKLGRQTNDLVGKLEDHYRSALEAGSGDAASAHRIDTLDQNTINAIARQRAEAQRPAARTLVEQAAKTGSVKPQAINALARGAKAAYEEGFGRTVTQAAPDALAVWRTLATDPCQPCEERDGQVFTLNELPGWPGDGDFGGDLCEGGPNDRCELEWRMPAEEPDEEYVATAELEKTDAAVPVAPSAGEHFAERVVGALERLADKPAEEHHHHVTVEQPPRGPVRVEKTRDGMRLIPEED